MRSRRSFLYASSASLALPHLVCAQSQDLDTAVARLEQLHSLQIRRGDEIVFAAAPRGPGLNRLANIKSCSKSIVALLLGVAIDRGEVGSVNDRLRDVAPGILHAMPRTARRT